MNKRKQSDQQNSHEGESYSMFHLLRLGTGSVFQMVFGALLVGFSIRGTINIRRIVTGTE